MSIPPPTPLSYTGDSQPVPYIVRTFDPDSTNYQFGVPTIWINKLGGKAWILLAKPDSVAYWELFTTTIGDLIDITVPNGTSPVVPSSAGTIAFTEGAGMTITGGTNTISFASTGGGYSWNTVTSTPKALVSQNIYVVNNGASLVTFTLPTSASLGDSFGVVGYGAGGWTITTSGTQTIVFGSQTASTSLSSTIASNAVIICCIVAGTTASVFKVIDVMGNLTIV